MLLLLLSMLLLLLLLLFIIDLCIYKCFCECFWVSVSTASESELRSWLVMSCAASLYVITPLLWNCRSVISLRHSHYPSLKLAKLIPVNFIWFLLYITLLFYFIAHIYMTDLLDYTCHISKHTLHLFDCFLLPSPHPTLSASLSVKTKYLSLHLTAPPQII